MISEVCFSKSCVAVTKLMANDIYMSYLINRVGSVSLKLRNDHFLSLSRIVVGQQLSTKVAKIIWHRLNLILGDEATPENISIINCDVLRCVGLSYAKIDYLKRLSEVILDGSLDLKKIDYLTDEEIIIALTQVKGIGRWTAEMFMIFSLGRLDILSTYDMGLRRAAQWLFGLTELPTPIIMSEIGANWMPYRTIASLYLWECIDRNIANKKRIHAGFY